MRTRNSSGFTLLEILVSMAVLGLLVVLTGQMVRSASSVVTTGNKHMDTDSQARVVFDRMAIDFAQMIKRSDVDIYVKGLDPETGNDRIAFFAQVPGYYPTSTSGAQSPLSLVAYRVNADSTSSSYNRMERMGKGLLWSAYAPTPTPSPLPSPNPMWIIFGGTPTLQTNWPSATLGDSSNANYKDSTFELIGSQIFRFEYFYLLKTGVLSNTPGGTGMQDVAAIAVTIAAIDAKSKQLMDSASAQAAPNDNLSILAGQLKDFDPAQPASDLKKSWQAVLDANTAYPRPAIAGIRLYQRYFALAPLK